MVRPLFIPSKMIRFQYASHLAKPLERLADWSHLVKPVAPHLLLCGNLGHWKLPQTQTFLKQTAPHFETITWIPAQEEFRLEESASATLDSMRSLVEPLGNIRIGTKHAETFSGTSVLRLATPGPHSISKMAHRLSQTGSQTPASLEYLRCIEKGERDWLRRQCDHWNGPLVCATYDMANPTKERHIHIFGEGPNISGTVGLVWFSCNSAIHPGFLKTATFDL